MSELYRASVQLHVKEKKSHLSRKNIAHCLAYIHWTIDDWSHVIFSYETMINKFSLDARVWC